MCVRKDENKLRGRGWPIKNKLKRIRAVVVAQLVEWLLLIPEVCGSNAVIGEILIENCLLEYLDISFAKQITDEVLKCFENKTFPINHLCFNGLSSVSG